MEREFEVIGEALHRLELGDPATAARIDDLRRIVGFRNRIIHGTDVLDDATVWGVIEGRLPRLIEQVKALLDQSGESIQARVPRKRELAAQASTGRPLRRRCSFAGCSDPRLSLGSSREVPDAASWD